MTTSVDGVDAELGLLTGPAAGEWVAAVLAPMDATVRRWAARQVDYQPRIGTTVSYLVQVRWPDGTGTWETFGASSGELPERVARVTDGETEVGLWRFPYDPDLPALPAVCDPARARRLLDAAGVRVGDGVLRPRVRAYRPRRRAVVEITASGRTVFCKVVRPNRAWRLYERHRVAVESGCPVPVPLGWTEDGLVVLSALPGRPLRDALLGDGPVPLDVDDVVATLDALPAALADGRRRRTWGQQAGHYAEVVAAAVPELAQRAHVIAAAVDHDQPEGPGVAVHGDFYESQLIVDDGRVTGLLDLDTAGRGERLDDVGCLLAHLAVLAQLTPARPAEINRLGSRLWSRGCRDLEPAALARRTAAVVLSLATGPHRVQEPGWRAATARRVDLAEWWLARSRTAGR